MKYVIVVPGGAGDRPVGALYGKTPLQAARLPTLDLFAREGLVGSADLIPEDVAVAPEAAAMALLGYPPARHYTGPGPLEVAGRGVSMERGDVAFRLTSSPPTARRSPIPPRVASRAGMRRRSSRMYLSG